MSIVLPDGWMMGEARAFGVVITKPGQKGGHVTVDERLRNFTLGMVVVRGRGSYSGRGWRERLYSDAVAALQAIWVDVE
jgi:hypothetical protein